MVGDNDGAAFITKAEFESLKNDFQTQINRYNSSLDNKIDGAIATYLAGVKVGKTTTLQLDSKCGYIFPLKMFYNSDAWNDPTSDYYSVARPEIHAKDIEFRQEMKYDGDNNTDAATIAGTILWTPDTMASQGISSSAPLAATNRTIPPTSTVQLFNTYMKILDFDIPGTPSELCLVSEATQKRRIGSVNYDVFDVQTKGTGYQIRYYKTRVRAFSEREGGAKIDYGYNWRGYAVCAASAMSPNTGTSSWNIVTGWWRTDNLNITGHHNSVNDADLLAWGEDQKFNTIKGNLTYYTGGYNTYGENLANFELQNSVMNWKETTGNHSIYAGDSSVHAELGQYFGYQGSFVKNNNANLYFAGILHRGQSYGSMFNYTSVARNYPLFQFKYVLFVPDLVAVMYNNSTKSNHVSGYKAYQIRYYDKNKDAHYLDEGMFLGKYDAECTVKFALKFGAKTGTKNVKVYLSKEPFSVSNLLTKTIEFNVVGESGSHNEWTVATNKELRIEVPNVEKNESLYLLWIPENTNDFVTLNSFYDYFMVS